MFVVHPTNLLAKLALEQIDGIFCAQRTGAWNGTTCQVELKKLD